jgi:hypothetical protein
MTNLRRTATIKAEDFCTLAYLPKKHFMQTKEEYPLIYNSFKNELHVYDDKNFKFRERMIANVPYFKNLDKEVIRELVYLLRPQKFD